jgi:hypothetical protein
MTLRKLFFRSAAILITALLLYVWLGVAYLNGQLRPWIYQVLS